ncbi:MAG: hypothetical protein ACPGN3_14270, partial [Opitutales bacterium]
NGALSPANYWCILTANRHNIVARDIRINLRVPKGFRAVGIPGYPEVRFDDGEAVLKLGELYAEERRVFLIHCVVDDLELAPDKAAELLFVEASYDDEINKGNGHWVGAQFVEFTESEKLSIDSINDEVGRDFARTQNLEVRQQALVLADQGRADEAVALLNGQIQLNVKLSARYNDQSLAVEAEEMEDIADELEQRGNMSSNSRKSFQFKNYLQKKSRY